MYKDIKNACDAYWWVYSHQKLQNEVCAGPLIEITPHMVNQLNCEIDDDDSLNTKLKWWVECGPYVYDYHHEYICSYDSRLECGSDTADGAILMLAKLVYKYYGDSE